MALIHPEILYLPKEITNLTIKKLEAYFKHRLNNVDKPPLTECEEHFAKRSYDELVLRHFAHYTNDCQEDLYRGGFSKLLKNQEFRNPLVMQNALSLFENVNRLKQLVGSFSKKKCKCFIGRDLSRFLDPPHCFSAISTSYSVHTYNVGTITLLGPQRMDYETLFGLLERASEYLTKNLTNIMYKYKLNFNRPESKRLEFKHQNLEVIGLSYKESKK